MTHQNKWIYHSDDEFIQSSTNTDLPCNNKIIFANEQQFKQKVNDRGQSIHYYTEYNGKIRIFCKSCLLHHKLIVCEIDGCDQGNILKICQQHPKCTPQGYIRSSCKKSCTTLYCNHCIPNSIRNFCT